MWLGDLEIDDESSTWDDWDEKCHGPMDSSENMEEHPEGFVWSCCEGDGRAEGCVESTHEPETVESRKLRGRGQGLREVAVYLGNRNCRSYILGTMCAYSHVIMNRMPALQSPDCHRRT